MYRQILVPLDGSRFAESVLPIALSLSRRTGAPVHLVTVQEPIPSFAYDEWESAAGEWSEEYLRSVVERFGSRAGGEVTTRLLTGHVVESLEEEAQARKVDLVVMATHGRGAFSRAWLGSVTDAFLHHTQRPVLLVRPEEDAEAPVPTEFTVTRILVPLDGTDISESALENAVAFGSLFGAAYHLVRVVPYPMQFTSPYLPHTMQMNQQFVTDAKNAADEYLENQAQGLKDRDLAVTCRTVVVPQPGHGILSELEDAECDFVAMATHGRAGLTRAILGSTTDKVIRGTHVPILLHRHTS
jgi:nucleotide-binding universal stress UspA family protein